MKLKYILIINIYYYIIPLITLFKYSPLLRCELIVFSNYSCGFSTLFFFYRLNYYFII